MMLIYQVLCPEFKIKKIADQFKESFKVDRLDESVPRSGIFIGSIEGCKWMQQNRPNVKVFATFDNYKCSEYYPRIQNLLFNNDYALVPLRDLARQKWLFYSVFSKDALIFVRPDSGAKDFPAEVVDIQNIDQFCEEWSSGGLAVTSSPKIVFGEWRFVICGAKIVAVSSYRYQGLLTFVPSAPQGAYDLVQNVIDLGVAPDAMFCIDVVQDGSKNFWVMELTSFSSASLYSCDAEKIAATLINLYD
jgi:hypothetical protein